MLRLRRKKRTIKHVLFTASSLGCGGAERVLTTIANELINRYEKVTVVLISGLGDMAYSLDERIRIVDCSKSDGNRIARAIGLYGNLRKTIKRERPDRVISFLNTVNMYTIAAMIGISIPLIVSERNDPASDPPVRMKRLMRSILYLLSNGFIFQTKRAQGYFSKSIQKRSRIICNPVIGEIPPEFTGERKKEIVSVGRLCGQKNHRLLIKAFSEISEEFPDYILTIYGEGALRADTEGYIESLGMTGRIFLPGRSDDVLQKINSSAMFVLSSDYEGMPNALIEAMCLGLPCIATDCPCGGPEFLIQNGVNGILTAVKDESELAGNMKKLFLDPAYAQRLGNHAKALRDKLSVERITLQYIAYLESV